MVSLLPLALTALLSAQLAFGYLNRNVQPAWTILPPAPTSRSLDSESFGDRQFLYRQLVLDLQNFGDTGGRSTRMADYDMKTVVGWLKALDLLDRDADHHLKLATQYFAFTPNKADLALLVDYVRGQVTQTPARHWRWLLEAVYIAQMKLDNLPLAAGLADQLTGYDFPDMPPVARQIAAALHERLGDYAGAERIIRAVLESTRGAVDPSETRAMEIYADAMHNKASQSPLGLVP